MKHTLTQEGKASPAVPHAFHQFQLIGFSLDDPIVLGKRKPCCHCFFVTYHASKKALELADQSRKVSPAPQQESR